MCSICMKNPCDPRCPNASEQKPVCECALCGYGIYTGQKYYDGADGFVCEDCMNGMSTSELMEMFGEEMKTA